MTIEEARRIINKKNKKEFKIPKFINKMLLIIVLFLATIVCLKSNQELRQNFYKVIYNDNINFASINKLYQKYFGSSIPFSIFKDKLKPVFDEDLIYSEKKSYLDGVSLSVGANYLVPSLDNGIIIFVGEKVGYGNTVIMECENGVEVWYSNINTINVNMYDYIDKGSLIGEVNENLYLVFMKDGEILNYEDYI